MAGFAILFGFPLALVFTAAFLPLPPALIHGTSSARSVVVRDRHGGLLAHVRTGDGSFARPRDPEGSGSWLRAAVLAAEDRRFFSHHGVDPFAVVRAAGQALLHGHVVSGASTLTQQVVRTRVPRPRTFVGKFREMALALRLERAWSKEEILEAYLADVSFGPRLRGVEAASRAYFDKPARSLSLAEAALLAGLPRGPTLYHPRRGTERARRRRDRILDRMAAGGSVAGEDLARAKAEPIVLASEPRPPARATHFVRSVLAELAESLAAGGTDITTTLDAALQREAEALVERQVRLLADRHVSAASVVVLDNATGDILAYVGSPDPFDVEHLGGNDGVRAQRQPGSTLKPFVYELAFERLAWTAATVLPDVEQTFPTPAGEFRPANYDGRYHGPVRLREALANSYNVPAVYAASVLGPARLLERLRAVGMTSLDQPAEHYGVALALGDGEVRLLDLAAAYATLARGGFYRTPRSISSWRDSAGQSVTLSSAAPQLVLDPSSVAVITDILSDPHAHLAAFGEGSFAFPYPVAWKTGTSQGYRDNLAVGYTSAVTVAVWAGNFDGSSMRGVSGISGAGPLLCDLMQAAMRERPGDLLASPGLHDVEICPLSGLRAAAACPHRRREVLAPRQALHGLCDWHEQRVGQKPVERLPPLYLPWARASGRFSVPLVEPRLSLSSHPPLVMLSPRDGAHFFYDPSVPAERQQLPIEVRWAKSAMRYRVHSDEQSSGWKTPPLFWLLRPGTHRLRIETEDGTSSEERTVVVE